MTKVSGTDFNSQVQIQIPSAWHTEAGVEIAVLLATAPVRVDSVDSATPVPSELLYVAQLVILERLGRSHLVAARSLSAS
jgi:hypothetical protein